MRDQARSEFEARYPNVHFGPVVAVIAAYDEEDNIGDVLKAMPPWWATSRCRPWWWWTGGPTGRPTSPSTAGVYTCVLPVNLGQGAALRLGYELASAHGATYVVTLDADGQNDPAEMPAMLEPLLEDSADFVIACRGLGVGPDHRPVPPGRGEAVRLGASTPSPRQQLTDSSNGYRAFRVDVLDDIGPHLVQDQYQTAEVVITASSRGWRITQQPTCGTPGRRGRPRRAGTWCSASATPGSS